jgi:anti-sigma B factor antagonist
MDIDFKKDGTTLTVTPEGRLDTATSPELEKRMTPEMEGMTEIIIDLANVEYVSSGGLRVLLSVEQEMEECGGKLTVIHVNSHIMEILDITGFLDIINVE